MPKFASERAASACEFRNRTTRRPRPGSRLARVSPQAAIERKREAHGGVLKHDPEKACPGLDPGWNPVFGKDHAQTKELDHDPIRSDRIMVWVGNSGTG